MSEYGKLLDVLILLLAAIISVPLLQRLRVSPVLGYLGAGIVVGPHVLGFIREVEDAQRLAEFGVVFLLFSIGLDLPLQRLRAVWRYLFGLGLAQVAATAAVIGLAAYALGASPTAAAVIGGALSLSSTATVLQLLAERGELAARFARVSIAILLFQDLAVVPQLTLLPLLAGDEAALGPALALALVKAAVALALIIFVGRVVLRPVYRLIASARNPEVFAATNLLVVLGTGWLTAEFGMSMALGAFLAGLMLAETEFRHQVEADIRPFRGLFLGLFFITVGMVIDVPRVAENLGTVVAIAASLLAGKTVLLIALCRLFGLGTAVAARVGLLLAQCGEFAFVVFGLAIALGVLPSDLGLMLIATVALTMATTPLLAGLGKRAYAALETRGGPETARLQDDARDLADHVIIAGYGRVGQIVARLLAARGVPYLAIDLDMRRVTEERGRGIPLYYGDASRREMLHAAGSARAQAVVVTLDQADAAERIVALLRQDHPDLTIIARGRDAEHGRKLQQAGATAITLEAVEPGLQMAATALRRAGTGPTEIENALSRYRETAAPHEPVD